RRESCLAISLINYEGKERQFTLEERQRITNGAVIAVEEGGDALQAVRRRLTGAAVRDELSPDLVRSVSYHDGETALVGSVSHHDGHFLERAVSGEPFQPEIFTGPRVKTVMQGSVELGNSVLENFGQTPLRIVGSADWRTYAIYNFYPESSSFVLHTP